LRKRWLTSRQNLRWKTWIKPSFVWAFSSNTSLKECLFTSLLYKEGIWKV
jgi:hypothetical protein